jgi:hypothetical protein
VVVSDWVGRWEVVIQTYCCAFGRRHYLSWVIDVLGKHRSSDVDGASGPLYGKASVLGIFWKTTLATHCVFSERDGERHEQGK